MITSASSLSSYAAQDECELDYTTASFLDCTSDSYDSVIEFRVSKNSADISTDSADSDELGHASDNGDLNTVATDSEARVTGELYILLISHSSTRRAVSAVV